MWCSQSQFKLLCLGGHQASLAARPLHGDSAGFNYPQLCFISLPSWALCPSVLCKYTTFTLKSRWDTDAQRSAHTHWANTDWRTATQREHACTDKYSKGHNNVNTCTINQFNLITLQKNISIVIFSYCCDCQKAVDSNICFISLNIGAVPPACCIFAQGIQNKIYIITSRDI